MKLPVYLFAGFLDSGKSTLLRTKVEQGDIPTDGPSLLLLCENGQTGFSPEWCARYQITPLRFKTPAELTAAAVGTALQTQPYQRVLVEYNGMWDFSAGPGCFPLRRGQIRLLPQRPLPLLRQKPLRPDPGTASLL